MKIYVLSTQTNQDGHQGYDYFTNKKKAVAQRKEIEGLNADATCTIVEGEVEISKDGIIRALNHWGDHPDNG